MKRTYTALATLLVVAILEVLAFGFFHRFGERLRMPNPERYLASPEEIAAAQRSFDPELGWRVMYNTPFGERPRAVSYRQPVVAAFGDSFTHGDEVGHSETWPAHLATHLQADVLNYGSSAYGMDQALLRMERDLDRAPTAFTILGFISYDIERNVSVYWKFLQPQDGLALTKPRFLLKNGALELLPNPIATAEEVPLRLREEAFIRQIGIHDWWYNPYRLPEPDFPRLSLFFRRGFWKAVISSIHPPDLWQIEEPRTIAELILVRFRNTSIARGARPIFLHLPVVWELLEYAKNGTLPGSVVRFLKICAARRLRCLIPLEEAAALPRDQFLSFFTRRESGGHYSDLGNRFIAQYLARYLAESVDFSAETISAPRGAPLSPTARPPSDTRGQALGEGTPGRSGDATRPTRDPHVDARGRFRHRTAWRMSKWRSGSWASDRPRGAANKLRGNHRYSRRVSERRRL